ncbi:MAG: 1-deoxy-D-xylulose-5-phosphate reductoisomerase [Eubacteriales bacterium]
MHKISILGSTGSIGTQALEVCASMNYKVSALTSNTNVEDLETQCRRFKPELAIMKDPKSAEVLKTKLADTSTKVLGGVEALCEAASVEEVDTVLTAVVGMAGLKPTLAAIESGKRIALANKETLVCAGDIVMEKAKEHNVEIIPVDSEHSAIFQCLKGNAETKEIRRLILTCSGGPFLGYHVSRLNKMTAKEALIHPKWLMGPKITIDSATLMNKGLELIEAMHLFQMPAERISVVIHPECVVHSMVEYCDHSIIAQMGTTDMLLPIQYALSYPKRFNGLSTRLDLFEKAITFAQPDTHNFTCLPLAIGAAKEGGTAGAILNAANEKAVELFLKGECKFLDIPRFVSVALEQIPVIQNPNLSQILEADLQSRLLVTQTNNNEKK